MSLTYAPQATEGLGRRGCRCATKGAGFTTYSQRGCWRCTARKDSLNNCELFWSQAGSLDDAAVTGDSIYGAEFSGVPLITPCAAHDCCEQMTQWEALVLDLGLCLCALVLAR